MTEDDDDVFFSVSNTNQEEKSWPKGKWLVNVTWKWVKVADLLLRSLHFLDS